MTKDIDAQGPAYHRIIGEPGSDLQGFVVVDRFVAGRGTGGIRCTESVSLEEVARLAREMTLKFAFLNLPSGGAKAGIIANPGMTPADRRQLFFRFGQEIGDLLRNGRYVGGLDMGTGPDDINALRAGAGLPNLPDNGGSGIDSNYFTALTVFVTVQALLECRGQSVRNARILVEGVGKVGGHLLRLLDESGASIVGVSTLSGAICDRDGLDVDRILDARTEHGDDLVYHYPGCVRLSPAELFSKSADVLIPGGGADSINAGNLDWIRARYIVPVANICASPAMEAELHRRGIEFVPGFVANAGGIFCWYLGKLASDGREAIIRDGFHARIKRLVEAADCSHRSISEAANHDALRKLASDGREAIIRDGFHARIMRLVEAADCSQRSISEAAHSVAFRNLAVARRLEDGDTAARMLAFGNKLSPSRLGYIVGSKIFGRDWGRSSNFFVRSYYDARYFS